MPNLAVPITPPRVALLDPRTGAISREWFQFFLSLQSIGQLLSELQAAPSNGALVAGLAELQKQVDALPTATVVTGESPASGALDWLAELQKQVNALTAPVAEVVPTDGLQEQIAELRKLVDALLNSPVNGMPDPAVTARLDAVEGAPVIEPAVEQIAEIQKQVDGLIATPGASGALDWLAELQKQVNAIPTGGGGATLGSATIDFGATPVAEGSFTITNASISATSVVQVFVMGDSTVDNDAASHQHAGASWQMTATPAAGSFALNITCLIDLCWGTFKIRYSYQ